MYDKKKVLETAAKYIGYREGSNNWNRFSQFLNETPGWYSWQVQNQPWCDIFVDAVFVEAYGPAAAHALLCEPYGDASASCATSASRFRAKGQFFTSGPQPGDQVFFGPNGGSHTGLVTAVAGNSFTTIEGNTSDGVFERTHSVGDGYTYGFGRPDWSLGGESAIEDAEPDAPAADPESAPAAAVSVALMITRPELLTEGTGGSVGSTGEAVRLLQTLLEFHGFKCANGGADGEFGRGTGDALEKFQTARGLTVDRKAGPETWRALEAIT